MKKSIYAPYLILLALLLVPVISCTTKTAAEKPQEPPARQEQPAADAAPNTGDTSAQPNAAETAKQPDASSLQEISRETAVKPDAASRQTAPQDAAVKPDAVSGATIDSLSGATVSHGQKDAPASAPAQQLPASALAAAGNNAVQTVTVKAPAAATVDRHSEWKNDEATAPQPPSPALAAADEQTASGTAPTLAPAHIDIVVDNQSAHSDTAAEQVPIASNTEAASPADSNTADAPAPTASAETASQSAVAEPAQPAASASVLPDSVPTAEEQEQSVAAKVEADTSEPASEQIQPDYETSLADLITDFEKQGGAHDYEPPLTFHEEMLDLFSPQIFTVALSKEPETEPKVKVSRMVAVEEKQRVEITYPGHGWVYVGEQTSQPGLKYEQRKLQDENSIFMFTAEKKGDYVLHFSYFDVFTNDFITDAVAVSVSAARSATAKSTVKAPEYQNEADSSTAEAQTEKTAQTPSQLSSSSDDIAAAVSAAQSTSGTTASQATAATQNQRAGTFSANGTAGAAAAETTGSATGQTLAATSMEETLNPDQLLEKARAAIASANAGSALTYLDTFFASAKQKLDEGWFLKGRAYELNGSARNIRLALDAYKTITDTFPQSKYWAEADARIRYITGFYINIR